MRRRCSVLKKGFAKTGIGCTLEQRRQVDLWGRFFVFEVNSTGGKSDLQTCGISGRWMILNGKIVQDAGEFGLLRANMQGKREVVCVCEGACGRIGLVEQIVHANCPNLAVGEKRPQRDVCVYVCACGVTVCSAWPWLSLVSRAPPLSISPLSLSILLQLPSMSINHITISFVAVNVRKRGLFCW